MGGIGGEDGMGVDEGRWKNGGLMDRVRTRVSKEREMASRPHQKDSSTYIFPMIPEDLVHISQRRQLRNNRLHPLDHVRFTVRAPLFRSTRRRQLRYPDPLIRPRIMQALDLINRTLRIHTIHMRGNNVNLVHTSITCFVKVGEVVTDGVGHARGEPLCGGFGIDEGHQRVCCIRWRSQRSDSAPGEVGFVEEFQVAGGIGGGDLVYRGGHVGRVHADGDLSCVYGAIWRRGSSSVVVVRVLGERCEGEADPVGNVVAGEGVPDFVRPARILGSTGVEDDVEETSGTVTSRGWSRGGVIDTLGIRNGIAASGE